MKVEVIKAEPINKDMFKRFINILGEEFIKWEEEKHEKKKETGSSEVLL